MKTAHWTALRRSIAARNQRMTEALARVRGPNFTDEVIVEPFRDSEGNPVLRDGLPVEVSRIVKIPTKRGAMLMSLYHAPVARRNLLRTVR